MGVRTLWERFASLALPRALSVTVSVDSRYSPLQEWSQGVVHSSPTHPTHAVTFWSPITGPRVSGSEWYSHRILLENKKLKPKVEVLNVVLDA